MADKRPAKIMVPTQGGMLRCDFATRLKLIFRLLGDRRVNFFLKFLPLASVAYLFWPIDAIALPVVGVLDDAAILWIGSTLFVELCPATPLYHYLYNTGKSSRVASLKGLKPAIAEWFSRRSRPAARFKLLPCMMDTMPDSQPI